MRLLLALLITTPLLRPPASYKVRVLSLASREDLSRWLQGGFVARLGLGHRGTVRAGQRTFFPIVAEKVPKGAVLVADFQVFGSDGRLVQSRPACCRAIAKVAGVVVLDPIPDLLLLPSDMEGLYTATATVRDRSGAERRSREHLVLTQ